MRDRISIIIPVYNTSLYLSECIESIIHQVYRNIEIILVNDGSTDGSGTICEHYARQDSRIIIINQNNRGVAKARQAGISRATGKYLCFVDSDDYISNEFISNLYKTIMKSDSDCCAQANFSINKPISIESLIKNDEALRRLCLLRFPTSMCAYMYKTELVKEIPIIGEVHFFEDFLFNFQFLAKAHFVVCTYELYYHYRLNESGANSSPINDKKMTCLEIYQLIIDQAEKYCCKKELQFFRVHCIITVLLSIAKSKIVDRTYIVRLQSEINNIHNDIRQNSYVPMIYKCLLLLFILNPLITIYSLKKWIGIKKMLKLYKM